MPGMYVLMTEDGERKLLVAGHEVDLEKSEGLAVGDKEALVEISPQVQETLTKLYLRDHPELAAANYAGQIPQGAETILQTAIEANPRILEQLALHYIRQNPRIIVTVAKANKDLAGQIASDYILDRLHIGLEDDLTRY